MKRSTGQLMTGLVLLAMVFTTGVEAKPKAIKVKTNPSETVVTTAPRNMTISGKQYIVLGGGARMIPDNIVVYQSCDKVDCAGVQEDIIKNLLEAGDKPYKTFQKTKVLRSVSTSIISQYKECMNRLGADSSVCEGSVKGMLKEAIISQYKTDLLLGQFIQLSRNGQSQTVRTDFEGNYSLTCPSTKCLVFSTGKASQSNGFWIKVIDSGSKFDLTNSSMVHSYNEP